MHLPGFVIGLVGGVEEMRGLRDDSWIMNLSNWGQWICSFLSWRVLSEEQNVSSKEKVCSYDGIKGSILDILSPS